MVINFPLVFLTLLLTSFSCLAEIKNTNNQRQPIQLTEDFFLLQVKSHHPILLLARLKQQSVTAQRLEKQGAFDPSINAGSAFKRYNSSADLGKVQEVVDSQFSIDFLTRYGIRITAGMNLAIGDIKTPVYPTGEGGEYFVDITLPLFRGAGINPESAGESKAFLREDQAVFLRRQVELLLLPDALNHYWNWVGAKEKLGVENELLEIAQFRTKAVQQKIEKGLLPEITGIEAEREVQRRLGRLYKAERVLQEAAFKLARFLWHENLEPASTPVPNQVPGNIPLPVRYTKERLSQGKLQALSNRPELQILNLAKEMAGIDQQLAQNTLLPQIDLFVTPGYQVGEGAIEGGGEIVAGISMSLPLFQRSSRGQVEQAKIAIENLTVRERQTIREIMLQIADKVSAVNATFDRYQAAEQELKLAKQLESGEKSRFEYGDSTLFLVNRRERASGEAKLGLINVLVEYHQAVADFRAATGMI